MADFKILEAVDLEMAPESVREEEETINTDGSSFSWVTPLEDFNIGSTAFRWFRLAFTDLELCGDQGAFDPSWLIDTSFEEIFDSFHGTYSAINWGLENGISPGQPFLVRFEKPIWSTYGGYDGPVEYDVDYPWDIVRILPRKAKTAADSWDRLLHVIKRSEERHKKRTEADQKRRLASPNKWTLTQSSYGGAWESTTLEVRLTCKFAGEHYGVTLARGVSECPSMSFEQAFWNLLKNFQKAHPTIDPYFVLRLAEGKVPITKWDHLRLQNAEDHA